MWQVLLELNSTSILIVYINQNRTKCHLRFEKNKIFGQKYSRAKPKVFFGKMFLKAERNKKKSNCSFSVFFSQITTFILLYQIQALWNKIEKYLERIFFMKIPFIFPGKIIKQDLTPRPNPMGIVLKNSCITVKVSSVHGICISFYV